METQHQQLGDVRVVTVQGYLDAATAVAFEEELHALVRDGERRLVVDFSPLDFVNSAGLKALLTAARKLDAAGGRMVLCGLRPAVQVIFDVIGFSRILQIVPGREQALRLLGGAPVAG